MASVLVGVLAPPIVLLRIWLTGERTEAARFLNRVERKTMQALIIASAVGAAVGAFLLGIDWVIG